MISPGLSSCENSLNTLRYADRVKELGASDPAMSGSTRGGAIDLEDEDDMNDDDDDLAQLRSLNEMNRVGASQHTFYPANMSHARLSRGARKVGGRQDALLYEQELSDDLFHHQSAITHLQTIEDEVLDAHRSAVEENDRWTAVDKSLLKMTDEVDYDVDAYAQQLEDLLAERIDFYNTMKIKVTQFRRQLAEEEKISRNFNNKK
ncbi:unnamed protein product [Notodromas monacha]|uniref:Kinesin motor domain-containing protein n=1 Tax=Notodromas monacha TaxID=399045 RepID=A0A7R9C013_9CRUS|nr:unnamed protein product [Notodromas monacha]CAG0923969.1 unnamed protein product [Notodromas monacha]